MARYVVRTQAGARRRRRCPRRRRPAPQRAASRRRAPRAPCRRRPADQRAYRQFDGAPAERPVLAPDAVEARSAGAVEAARPGGGPAACGTGRAVGLAEARDAVPAGRDVRDICGGRRTGRKCGRHRRFGTARGRRAVAASRSSPNFTESTRTGPRAAGAGRARAFGRYAQAAGRAARNRAAPADRCGAGAAAVAPGRRNGVDASSARPAPSAPRRACARAALCVEREARGAAHTRAERPRDLAFDRGQHRAVGVTGRHVTGRRRCARGSPAGWRGRGGGRRCSCHVACGIGRAGFRVARHRG